MRVGARRAVDERRVAGALDLDGRDLDPLVGLTCAMAAATAQMNDNTTQMKGATDGMSDVMSGIYDSGRQGASVDLRNKQWDLLIRAGKPDEKGAHAALFS